MSTLLDVRDLSVAFAGRTVVQRLSFSVAAGERVALVGESGSGKTVSALSLLRLVEHATLSGQALFDGRDLLAMPERELRTLRGRDIAVIFQEPMTALNPLMRIGDQIAEVLTLQMGWPQHQTTQRVLELLAETGIDAPERCRLAYPHQLSGGQRQRAMIAMALACQPKLLLADEPTTALDVSLRGQILDLLVQLQQRHGMAVLMITHDLNLVRRFAQRVLVMAQGQLVEQGPTASVFAQPQQPYTQRLIASRPERDPLALPAIPDADPMLHAKHLRVDYPVRLPGWRGWFGRGAYVAVRDATFTLPRGRTLGVIGESGSGKSTLALATLGLLPFSGDLTLANSQWSGRAATDKALRRRVQVVFQDPFSSLSPRLTVQEIVGEGLTVHEPALTPMQRRQRVVAMLQEVGLVEPGDQAAHWLDRYPHEFSGGQRQRLAIARALIVRPELLVLDEPTSALDVTVQKQVLQLLQKLQREHGLSYLLITHDIDVIRAMAHEVIVMQRGEIVESASLEQILSQPRHHYTRILIGMA